MIALVWHAPLTTQTYQVRRRKVALVQQCLSAASARYKLSPNAQGAARMRFVFICAPDKDIRSKAPTEKAALRQAEVRHPAASLPGTRL